MRNPLWLFGILGLFAMVLMGAAGCSWLSELPLMTNATATPSPALTISPQVTPTPTPTATPRASNQGMTIELWVPEFLSPYGEDDVSDTFAAQLAQFSSSYTYRDLRINTSVKKDTGVGGLLNLLTTASEVAPSVLPDLLILNQHDVLAAAAEGLLQPLGTFLPSDVDYYTPTLTSVRDTTGLWAMPYLARADQMVYREGVTETTPLTWSAVLSGSYAMLIPGAPSDGLAGDALLQIYLGSGGRVVDQSGQASLDRVSLERTYGFFSNLQRRGLLDADLALTLPNASACWTAYQSGSGDLAPVPFGAYWANPLEDSVPAWAPTEAGAPVTVVHTWGIAVVTQDPVRRDAALLLARWLIAGVNMGEMAQVAELVPARPSAFEAWEMAPEDRAFVDTLLSHGIPALSPSVDTPVRRALQAGLVALLQRDADTPEEAASTALTALRR